MGTEMTGSWLIRNEMDRERLLDMERRVKPVRAVTIATVVVATLAATGWLGWPTMGAILPPRCWSRACSPPPTG